MAGDKSSAELTIVTSLGVVGKTEEVLAVESDTLLIAAEDEALIDEGGVEDILADFAEEKSSVDSEKFEFETEELEVL